MRIDDFIEALYKAGWDSPSDAQHTNIRELHKKLWPELAKVDEELQELYDKGIEL